METEIHLESLRNMESFKSGKEQCSSAAGQEHNEVATEWSERASNRKDSGTISEADSHSIPGEGKNLCQNSSKKMLWISQPTRENQSWEKIEPLKLETMDNFREARELVLIQGKQTFLSEEEILRQSKGEEGKNAGRVAAKRK